MTTFAIQERAVSENPNAGPQGKGWQTDIAFTLEARNKVQAIAYSDKAVKARAKEPTGGQVNHIAANDNHIGDKQALRFLSVCSGIEAASVAWPQWRAVAFSEIEKFPSAVLAHHYPAVPNLGDFTKIDTTSLGRADILCGGTPCQAFSVAGLRRSLADERGNLSLAFVELAHELAGLGRTNGNGLRNVVWETSSASCPPRTTPSDASLPDLWAQTALSCRQADGQTRAWFLDRKDGLRGEFSTLNTSEWPNDAAVSSLSQTLETGPIPQRFFLSRKACAGILRRAEKRGKELPEQLRAALESVSGQPT